MGFLDSLFGPKESEEVTRLREKAEAGDAIAMYNLANAYLHEKGVKQDIKIAWDWILKSATAGYDVAQIDVGLIYEDGLPYPKVDKNYAAAYEWYQKAAAQGNMWGINNIGWLYYNGDGVQKDYATAKQYFEKAAEMGCQNSMYGLGLMCYNGYGQNIDYETAVFWYRKAAELGHDIAQNNLGWCYQNGHGVEKDTSMAVMWYRKAAAQGQSNAIANLKSLGITV